MKHVTRLRAIAAAGAASLLAAGGGMVAASSASANVRPARLAVAGTHPAWATAKALVSTKVTGSVTANVYLATPNASGLAARATAVSTPGSSQYHHYLSAAQTLAQYAPSAAEATSVRNWATSVGLKVGAVTSGAGAYVQVTGSADTVAAAFSVKFGLFKDGKATYRAPQEIATLPSSIAGDVMTVTGLDSAKHLMKPDDTLPGPSQNYFVAPYTSTYYGEKTASGKYGKPYGSSTKIPAAYGKAQPWTNGGYTPAQIRGAYNVSKSGETGKGVTVAVIDAYASPTMLTDANKYAAWAAAHGGSAKLDKPFAKGQYKQVPLGGTNGWQYTADGECGASGWYGEESLDVESVHAMAPDANVTYVGAASCDDDDLGNALAYVVNHHAASIVSNSWGEPSDVAPMRPVYDVIFQLGAIEGIGFYFSSGDSGYEDPNYQNATDAVQADYPSSSPWITSVGGTSLAIGKTNNYQFETSWGTTLDPLTSSGTWTWTPPGTAAQQAEGYDGSGGGGVSAYYTQPSYQKPVVPHSLATTEVVTTPPATSTGTYKEKLVTVKSPMRVTPDVSAIADPSTGIAVGETLYGPDGKTKAFYVSRIGGTSLASPIFAGIEADAQQAYQHTIGFANPVIYYLDKVNKTAFNDVTDHPFGVSHLGEIRSNYANPYTKTLPVSTYLRTLGINGVNSSALGLESALQAKPGYDEATGVGSPANYIQAFKGL